MLLLPLGCEIIQSRRDEPVHDDPFGDWGAVDAGDGGDGDVGVGYDGVRKDVVYAGGDGVDVFEAGEHGEICMD